MKFSGLQRFILEECLEQGNSCSRYIIDKKYDQSRSKSQKENFKKIITQSIERLISRGMVVGYGFKTKEKLFITTIKLTTQGKRVAKEIRISHQKKLPLKTKARVKSI